MWPREFEGAFPSKVREEDEATRWAEAYDRTFREKEALAERVVDLEAENKLLRDLLKKLL